MKHVPSRLPHRLAVGAVAVLTALAFAACGDSEEEVQKLNFKVNAAEGGGTTIATPKSAEAGPAEIKFGNNSLGKADLQLIRVEGSHSDKEVFEALNKATKGKPYPEWFFAAGGIGLTQPGDIVTVEQVLRPGTYYAFDTEGGVDEKSSGKFDVTGEASDDELEAESTITAGEYVFKSEEPLPAGTSEILFDNAGAQPHHMLAAKLIGEATAEDVEKAFKSKGKEQPPFDEESLRSTAVVEGGEGQVVSFELEPGRYALFCFITDRQGGPRHALKGMVDEIEVEKAEEE